MKSKYDVIIVGSGFGGSLLAMAAKHMGLSVLLLERGTHPRVVIGESSTPLSNLLLEEFSIRYDLPRVRQLCKWGTWQRSHPDVACGLKRGFTFHHHTLSDSRPPEPEYKTQLLVEASPRDEIADTHWYRADFDHLLLREAQSIGVEYLDKVDLRSMCNHEDEVRVEGHCCGESVAFCCRFLIDGSGPRGYLHRVLDLREAEFPGYPATCALYSHFSGVGKLRDGVFSRTPVDPPYPIDDAAVHHVFDGGWIWVLQFNNGITSAGVAATKEASRRLMLQEGAAAWSRLISHIPALAEQFQRALTMRPFTYSDRLSFLSEQVVGSNWALLPSAAGFIDPLLSTGFPLTLLGVLRLASIMESSWGRPELQVELQSYAQQTRDELLATSRLIGALYASMDNFPLFKALSLLYFSAASYSEAARRLGKPQLASSFLLHDHPVFGLTCRRILDCIAQGRCQADPASISDAVMDAVKSIDVAGLSRPTVTNWYPVKAMDLVDSAWKLDASEAQAAELLQRCGLWR
ncbi:MAG TPA: tryptophan 7-halogenase [Acidisarcina sp.]